MEKTNTKLNIERVMVWGYTLAEIVRKLVFVNEIIDSKVYVGILKMNLKSSSEKLGLRRLFLFMHDNDPKHSSLSARH